MGIFKKLKKVVKKVFKPVGKLIKQAIGGLFKMPKIPRVPDPASAPTFASAGGPASRAGFSGVALGPSLISSGGISGLAKRAKTKKRTLIGGA